MPYFSALDAPPADGLSISLHANLTLRVVFQGSEPPKSEPTARLLFAYLLVVDKAVREYTAGREALLKHANEHGGIAAFVEGVGRFETCINSVKRALRLLQMLGTQLDAPPTQRALRKLAQAQSDSITTVRDAIEHIDQDIASGAIAGGDAHLLTVNPEGHELCIAEHRITFRQLHTTVRALHSCGLAMLEGLPRSASDA